MKATIETPNITRITYHQDKNDSDYGSCLWAYFNFDLEKWILSIQGDCGDYAYRWPQEENRNFLAFCSGLNADYLLKKLCKRETVDIEKTLDCAKEALEDMELEPEKAKEALDDLELLLDEFRPENSVQFAQFLLMKWNDDNDLDIDAAYDLVDADYSAWQKRIVHIFCEHIQQELKKMVKDMEWGKDRQHRCRYCHPFMGKNHNESHCVVDGWEDEQVKIVSKEECDQCDHFDSKFIEYPLTINGLKNTKIDTTGFGHDRGCLCEVRPCGKEYEGKSYIGIYLGDLPIAINTSYSNVTGILTNSTMNNPAIFVPELKKIVYGCGSWWREIKSVEDFNGISDEDIENTWYVKLLKEM